MTDEEAQKLREELENAKAANAFLYLALQSLGEIVMKMPEWSGKAMAGRFAGEDSENFSRQVDNLNEMMLSAHKCIWDDDGKPR